MSIMGLRRKEQGDVTFERKSKPDDMLEMGLVERTKSTRMAMRLQSGCESHQEGNLSRRRRVNYAEDGSKFKDENVQMEFVTGLS